MREHRSATGATAPLRTRALGPQDLLAFRAMLAMFGRAFDAVPTYTANQPDDAYLKTLLESRNFVALAAFSGTDVVGGLAGYVLPKFEQARSELYIYDLAVDAAHRRRGVATAIIRELQSLAAARGIHVIFVQANPGDDAAIALYAGSVFARKCFTSTSRLRACRVTGWTESFDVNGRRSTIPTRRAT